MCAENCFVTMGNVPSYTDQFHYHIKFSGVIQLSFNVVDSKCIDEFPCQILRV